MKRRDWMIVLAAFLGTASLASLTSISSLGGQTLRIGIELDTLVLIVGLALSGVVSLGLLISRKQGAALQTAVSHSEDQAVQERQRFLRRLDHELKNPLTAIRAGLANLDPVNTAAQWNQSRESIESQVLRLSRLTSDLRKLADLESRPLTERDPIDMEDLIQEAFDAARNAPASAERSMTLTMPQAPWPLPQVTGDRDLLFLALFNLLDNALKFTGPGDTVELRSFESGASIVVEVADTGKGISPEDAKHVWEDLYRGRDAQGVPGSGLGLSLVKVIVERHGGTLELRSRPNHGTVISVSLPQRS
ncbi:MAG: HAMP domain-containing sensor histidine kinase [Anaerolineales bacterium]